MSVEHLELALPRNAFSARDAARAGDVWRCFQDAAVLGSSRCGWPPSRYTAERCAFVVRAQTVVHHREARFGQAVKATTWVERFRRAVFSTRQTRLLADGQPLASATQEWVHVTNDGGTLKAARASEALLASFVEVQREPLVELPGFARCDGRRFGFEFRCWFTWMDPLDHANHPAYVDWCDEAVCRELDAAGLSPLALQPVAESVQFRSGVVGGAPVRIEGRLAGLTDAGDAALSFHIHSGDTLAATATLVRRLVEGPQPLVAALQGAR